MENEGSNPTRQPLPQPPAPKKWYQHKGVLAILVLVLITILVGWFYSIYNQNRPAVAIAVHQVPKSIQGTSVPLVTMIPASIVTNASSSPGALVKWTALLDQNLFTDNCNPQAPPSDPSYCQEITFSYYDISTAVSGLKPGTKLILFDCGCIGGLGEDDKMLRFLQNGNSYTLLQKYSFPLNDLLQEFPEIKQGSFIVDSTFDIPDLDIPKQITDPQNGAVLTLATDPAQVGDFFDNTSTPIFTDNFGLPVYATTKTSGEYFDVASPDETSNLYELSDPLQKEQENCWDNCALSITWNNAQNYDRHYVFDPAGTGGDGSEAECEEGANYTNAVSMANISNADLVVIGTDSSGQSIYGFKDPSNPILQAAQAQLATLGGDAAKQVYPPYLVIFWKDPFGRLMRLVNTAMLESCGA